MAGAMLLFKSGLWAVVESGALPGLTYCSKEEARVPKRREARVAEMATKRATATRKILGKRGSARLSFYTMGR